MNLFQKIFPGRRTITRHWLVVGLMGGLMGGLGLSQSLGYWQQRGERPPARQEGRPLQEPDGFPGRGGFPGGPGGFPGGFPGGPGGPGGGPEVELVEECDANGDGWLNAEERRVAKEKLGDRSNNRGPGGRRGPRGGFPGNAATATEGRSLTPGEVANYPDSDLYDDSVLRTIFIQFDDSEDWNQELVAFKSTDVEVPATVSVDGVTYKNVGIKYRGNSSYGMVPDGFKKSLNLSMDMDDRDQDLYGYRTLNLLNCNGDPSLLSSALYSHVVDKYMAAPKANLVRVVINGECWGLYANVQQFNKDFLQENYGQSKGARWKVPGRPNGDGGLRFMGDSLDEYRSRYEIKSKDRDEDWQALMELCRVIDQTPAEELPSKLEPIMDIPQLLWFLAADVASVNSDGYWTRASDYNIYRDTEGVFHISPYDMNEAFMTSRHGPGPGGPPPGEPGGFGLPGMFGFPPPPPGEAPGLPPGEGQGRPPGPPGNFLGFGGPPPEGGPQDRPEPSREGDAQRPARRPGEPQEPGFQQGRRGRQDRGQRGQRGPGGRRGPGGPMGHGAVDLDPLVGMDDPNKPLRSKILAVPQWKQQYLQNLKTLAEVEFASENIGPFIKAYRQLLQEDVELETRRTSSTQEFLTATDPDVGADGSLMKFFQQRRQFLLKHEALKQLPASDDGPVRARVVPTAPKVTAAGQSPVVINELLADSESSADWLELYNGSDESVDLSGYWLSDSEDLKKWPIPDGTRLAAGDYLLIWADDAAESGLHAGFKLSRKGEVISLVREFEGNLEILDRVEFPQQTTEVSFGRYPNWSGGWQALAPTPGNANRESEN